MSTRTQLVRSNQIVANLLKIYGGQSFHSYSDIIDSYYMKNALNKEQQKLFGMPKHTMTWQQQKDLKHFKATISAIRQQIKTKVAPDDIVHRTQQQTDSNKPQQTYRKPQQYSYSYCKPQQSKKEEEEVKTSVKCFANNQNKNYVNMTFVSKVAKLMLPKDSDIIYNHYIGVLDGLERNTTNMLLSVGIDPSYILLVESDNIIAKSHIESDISCSVHEGTLLDFADTKHDKLYSAWRRYYCLGWYFDTCRTIQTETAGILGTIEKTRLINGTVLAFTFCMRGMTRDAYETSKCEFINKLIICVGLQKLVIKRCNNMNHYYNGHLMFDTSRGTPMNSFDCIVAYA